MVQTALYGTERLSHEFNISHAINLVIVDDVVYVWWYDREGAIQSHGINFVQDLPYFLVLLLAFQRFTEDDWGIISAFRAQGNKVFLFSFPATVPALDIVIEKTGKVHDHYGIVGRATRVLRAESKSESLHPRTNQTLKGLELVLKISWPEASRVPEGQIIEAAVKLGEHNDNVRDHLPDLISACDLEQYSTTTIRKALGINCRGPRVLRVILFRRLYPITDLVGDEFWKAFWECFRCHCHLWVGGVKHNDISVKNLMYDKLNDDHGVLNDYDLSHLQGTQRPSGTERTGTKPFMALDLLTDDSWAGLVQ